MEKIIKKKGVVFMKEKIKNEIYEDLKAGKTRRYDINTDAGYISIETYISLDGSLLCEIVENNSVVFDGWIADSIEGIKLTDVEYIVKKLVV